MMQQPAQTDPCLRDYEKRSRRQGAAITELAGSLHTGSGDSQAVFKKLLQTAADAARVDRAVLWLLSDKKLHLKCAAVPCFESPAPAVCFPSDALPRYLSAILADKRIAVADVKTDLRTCEMVREYFDSLGITSVLNAGIFVKGELAGFISLEHIGENRQWHPDEKAFASMIAALAGQVIITDKYQYLESQLHQSHKMAALGTLTGGIVHDFNNILQAVTGHTQLLLRRKPQNYPDYDRLCHIEQACDRAGSLIRQVLAYSRKKEPSIQAMDLNHEVKNTINMLTSSISRLVQIRPALDKTLWPVNADPVQVQQILMNLAANGADAMPAGGILTIVTQNRMQDTPGLHNGFEIPAGRYVVLQVSDTGYGMDETVRKKVFEPFFTTKKAGKGTGLGLSSVYGMVKSLGGYVLCASEKKQGTTFTIYLPAVINGRTSGRVHLSAAPVKGGRETVMVVDDDPVLLDLTREILTDAGYTVLLAASGEAALDIRDRHAGDIDLVLLDLGLPGMDGHQCLAELVQRDPGVKVLIVSGYADESVNILSAGAVGFISKPYHLDELLARMRSFLDRQANLSVY